MRKKLSEVLLNSTVEDKKKFFFKKIARIFRVT